MKLAQLVKQLQQGKTDPMYVILGQEDYLIQQTKLAFKKLLSPDEMTMNFGEYDMTTTPVAVALNDAISAPFLGERRVVFIENPYFLTGETVKNKITHDLDGVLQYVTEPQQSTILVFFAPYEKLDARKKVVKQLKKKATLIDVSRLNERESTRFVQQRIEQDGFRIAPDALRLLSERTDGNLTQMMNEVTKLETYAAQSKQIDAAAVDQLVAQSLEDNVFHLVDAVLSKQTAQALEIYRELLLQKEEPIGLNAIVLSQFRLLLQVKILSEKGYSQGNLASTLKVHPYRIKLALQQAKRFSRRTLKAGYLGLEETEVQMKSGQMDKNLAFELFVLKFAAA
ncbi:holA protein [Lactobacillus selangorensis]|uniref:DNA polymerase III subunit delta n=1 Tax=Lactobacillus selangorensis TaxID=81857 RepID=A0A0R2G925_9LACO|nr:DNA polymerase III subunit delta [Lactobacillus selangorensis]KRN29400.1 holA protein [Lactobacillus selangorensis]KRN34071.1 holA protein [Lactobacillus selangorensis]